MAVYQRPGSPNWVIEFEYQGQRIRRSSGTDKKREAQEVERNLRQQLKQQAILGKHVDMTLADAIKRYAATVTKNGRSDGTRETSVFKVLGEAFGTETPLDKLTAPVIHKWRDELVTVGRGRSKKTDANDTGDKPAHKGEGHAQAVTKRKPPAPLQPASINRYLDILKAILRKAHDEWGALAVMPKIKPLKANNARLRFLDKDEERRLLDNCPVHLHRLLTFLLGTGVRLGEALGLTWDMVDLSANTRAAIRLTKTKNGMPRRVPLPNKVRDLLVAMKAEAPKGQPRVFVWVSGQDDDGNDVVVPFNSVKRSFDTARVAAGLPDITLHTMRHTYASRLVMRGVPIFDVSKLLGHTRIEMTMRYAHLAPEGLEASVALLDS